jgi:hypothetical protein
MMVYEVRGLVLADRGRVAFSEEKIGHFSYILRPGRKSSRIQIEDILDDSLFFVWRELARIGGRIAS